tara:strand:+ start:156 stop:470 length:315 start_codon:yes stop_codon:yes gene_type:complete
MTRQQEIIKKIREGNDYFSNMGIEKYKFQIILEGDFGQVTIGSNSKSELKQIVKILIKDFNFNVEGVEFWKNDDDEWEDCGMGSNSLINFSEWFNNFNWKNRKL